MAMVGERYARGDWITPGLIRFGTAVGLLLSLIAIGLALATASGTLDAIGRPLGTDFTSFWAAGRLALGGRAVDAYDWAIIRAAQQELHGGGGFFPWSYPPVFLLVAAGLAALPYLPALIVWQTGTLGLALVAVRAALPGRLALAAVVGSPLVLVCVGHGQTGFLTAALLGGGLLALPRRELAAGILFGLAAYKPQFGLLLPLALAAGGYWRAIAAAAATVAALLAVTLVVWGVPVWQAFLDGLPRTSDAVLLQGAAGYAKLASVFGAVRLWGGSVGLASACQLATFLAAAALCVAVWRRPADVRLKGAALLAGTLLSTPYVLDYDLTLLGMAAVLIVSHGLDRGFGAWEKTLAALVWLLPAGGRVFASALHLPVGPALVAAVLGLAVARARDETAAAAEALPAPA